MILMIIDDYLYAYIYICDGMHILLKGHSHSIFCTRMLIWSRALAIARAVSYRTFGRKNWSLSAVPLEHMAS